ncbi:PH domain-containing protein [Candidatus Pacearchaeota archaeon]|nr:PH domain-containing protein [Candidatus Pacearchaeota archaeon]
MSHYIDNILERSEHKKWEGKINRKVMVTGLILGLVIVIGLSAFFFAKETINYTSNGTPKQISGFSIGSVVLGVGLLIVILDFFSNFVVEYAITNKRVIIKSGLIGTDYKSIYYEQINQVVIDVGLIGKIFGTGNLKIDTGKTETYSKGGGAKVGGMQYQNIKTRTMYDVLKNINTPYEVYNFIQPSITGRRESLYSGRADKESNPQYYK